MIIDINVGDILVQARTDMKIQLKIFIAANFI